MGNIIVADWLRITYRFCENAGMNFNLRMNVSGILPLATSLQISLSHSSPPPMVLTFFLVALLQRARRYLGVPLLPGGHLTCTLSPLGAQSGCANFAAKNCVFCFSSRMLRRGSFIFVPFLFYCQMKFSIIFHKNIRSFYRCLEISNFCTSFCRFHCSCAWILFVHACWLRFLCANSCHLLRPNVRN